jgi:hypothetical protein
MRAILRTSFGYKPYLAESNPLGVNTQTAGSWGFIGFGWAARLELLRVAHAPRT